MAYMGGGMGHVRLFGFDNVSVMATSILVVDEVEYIGNVLEEIVGSRERPRKEERCCGC